MWSLRTIILITIALMGLAIGALFAFFMHRGQAFVTVEINDTALMAEVASHRTAWARGLSGREPLAENEAMLFLFDGPDSYAIWMKQMRFPIDIFWIKDNTISDIQENASVPASGTRDTDLPVYRPDGPADFVLETRAGFAQKHGIKIGDHVDIKGLPTTSANQNATTMPPVSGEEFTIPILRQNPAYGRDFRIGEVATAGGAYEKFPITYTSGARILTGIMNVPAGPVPDGGFPVLILNHGLIDPAIYTSGRGSKREQDFFARHGYITLHPDYRGHASSSPVRSKSPEATAVPPAAERASNGASPNPATHHDFYVGYTQDVMALVDAVKNYDGDLMDKNRIGMWGHSMGGGIAARVMTLSPDIRAYVLFAPISADAEENFYELTDEEIAWLYETYGAESSEIYRRISPIAYFQDVRAPVQLHHGTADRDVPIAFSETMFGRLTSFNKKAELFTYPGEGHEFADAWQTAADRALQFFDRYVKNAR